MGKNILYIIICILLFIGGYTTCYYTNRRTDIITQYQHDTIIGPARDSIIYLENKIKNNYITSYKTRKEYLNAPLYIQDSLWIIAYNRADSVLQYIDSTKNK